MGRAKTFAVATVVAVFAVIATLYATPRANIPAHLLGHKLVYAKNFIPVDVGAKLVGLMKEMKSFPTNAADLTFYKTKHEHIGEAIPISADGRCEHPFLIPNSNRSECVLPGRIDVARHYVLTGGPDGIKETYEKLVSRVQSFGRYMFDLEKYPLVQDLFASPSFMRVARAICPEDRQHLDPFQFNFIIQIPGQTVAMHTDAPYFWGASRFQYPQWMLAAMVFSNLFPEAFVDQVQVVGYLHSWTPDEIPDYKETVKNAVDLADPVSVFRGARRQVRKLIAAFKAKTGLGSGKPSPTAEPAKPVVNKGGEFVFWDDTNPIPKREQPWPLAGSAVDGSKLVHAAVMYRPHDTTPFIDKSKKIELVHDPASDKWKLAAGAETFGEYTTDDLRISIVYRARCMRNDEELKRYNKHQYSSTREEFEKNEKEYVAERAARRTAGGAAGAAAKKDGCDDGKCREWNVTTLEGILQRFVDDLVKRGKISVAEGQRFMNGPGGADAKAAQAGKAAARLELAFLIMDEYIKYPLASTNEAYIPFNYCALGAKVPQLSPLLKTFC